MVIALALLDDWVRGRAGAAPDGRKTASAEFNFTGDGMAAAIANRRTAAPVKGNVAGAARGPARPDRPFGSGSGQL
jgi:hypothetical protein